MARKLTLAVVALFAVVAGMVMVTLQGNAATLSPTQRACHAFTVWDHHRTPHNLAAMLAASRHASATVKTDIIVDVYDVRHNYFLDLPGDVAGTRQDCKH